MIRLEDVTRRYGDTPAVDRLSLEINKGEVCVLIGPSGCGKTTTLRMINRLIEPTSGKVYINGQDAADIYPQKLRLSIGYAIQGVGLFPHMTVAGNIAVVPRLIGWDKARIAARVAEMLKLVGLDPSEYAAKYPAELSGGQAQRIGVARALAADPPVLLMDEPFGAVDPLTRERLQSSFARIQRELKKTVLMVTHDLDEAIRLADRIAIMAGGRLVQYDTPEAILSRPANKFVRDFVGTDRALKRLSRLHVGNFLRPVTAVHIETPAAEVLAGEARWRWVVNETQQLIGWVDKDSLGGGRSISDAMYRAETGEIALANGATLREALSRILGLGFRYVPVVDENGRLIGEVALRDIEAATNGTGDLQ